MEVFSIDAALFWFLLGVAFLVLEALTPGFVLMFFGIGAWAVSLFLVFIPTLGVNLQLAAFIVASMASLMGFRRRLKSLFAGRMAKTDNLDDSVFIGRYVGREVEVVKEVGREFPGLVELNGTNWNAKSEGGSFAAGDRARVLRLDGLTLVIGPIQNPEK